MNRYNDIVFCTAMRYYIMAQSIEESEFIIRAYSIYDRELVLSVMN